MQFSNAAARVGTPAISNFAVVEILSRRYRATILDCDRIIARAARRFMGRRVRSREDVLVEIIQMATHSAVGMLSHTRAREFTSGERSSARRARGSDSPSGISRRDPRSACATRHVIALWLRTLHPFVGAMSARRLEFFFFITFRRKS